eukprot:jgi/Botrbrau1/15081/Bobra.0286s0010.1
MATDVASPNGVFKRLDLEEKDMISPTETNTANPTTPSVPSENVDMEITPTALDFPDASQEFQDTVVDETIPPQAEAQYNSSEFENQEGNADGDHVILDAEGPVEPHTGDGGDTKEEHEGVVMNHHSAYLAGVTRGADYEHAHDTVARAATAAAQGVKSSTRGSGRGRGAGSDAGSTRGSDYRGPITEKPTHFTPHGGGRSARGGLRPDMGRGSDSRGPPPRETYAGANSVSPGMLPYYTRGADYEEAHDAVARAASSAAGGTGGSSGSGRGKEPEYAGGPPKRWEQGGGQAPSWQESQKPAGPAWGEAPKTYQQPAPTYQQAPQAQYQQSSAAYTGPPTYQEQQPPQQAQAGPAAPAQGAPPQSYTDPQAYQGPAASYEQPPQQHAPAQGFENYGNQGYNQQQYNQAAYTQPAQPGYTQDYSQQQYQQPPAQGYAPANQEFNAQAGATPATQFSAQAPASGTYAPAPAQGYQAYQ